MLASRVLLAPTGALEATFHHVIKQRIYYICMYYLYKGRSNERRASAEAAAAAVMCLRRMSDV